MEGGWRGRISAALRGLVYCAERYSIYRLMRSNLEFQVARWHGKVGALVRVISMLDWVGEEWASRPEGFVLILNWKPVTSRERCVHRATKKIIMVS